MVGMKPLSERDENLPELIVCLNASNLVGMKPLSERDENYHPHLALFLQTLHRRNEATL